MINVLAVVGGQYGSEGKGVIVAHLANQYQIHVRTGGPNAGHSFWHQGKVYKMQVIPCGWINPKAKLVIGRGALVDLEQLQREIRLVKKVDPTITDRLIIDSRAGYLDPAYAAEEGGVNGEMHARIGSTGKGVGVAREHRIHRDPTLFALLQDMDLPPSIEKLLRPDTDWMVSTAASEGIPVLLEGTQGAGLSLIHGEWPYVTSADTNAAQMAVDVGLPPRYVTNTLLVVRTHPIRVAGRSGPMYNELNWDVISKRMGRPTEERTTVTDKVRRIGEWDNDLFRRACLWNAPTSLALTFVDYLCPEDEGKVQFEDLCKRSTAFINYLETIAHVPVVLVGTGGKGWQVIDRGLPL